MSDSEELLEEITITDFLSIEIKFSNGDTLELEDIPPYSFVRDLVDTIKKKSEEESTRLRKEDHLEGKYLKLIYEGKILEENKKLEEYRIEEESIIHCSVSDFPPNRSNENNEPNNHSRVDNGGNDMYVENLNDINNNEDELQGFDRMRDQGFSDEEIGFFRNQFYSSRPHLITQLEGGELTIPQLRRMEEEWLNEEDPILGTLNVLTFDPVEDIPMYRSRGYEGNDWDFFLGITSGFVFGIAAGALVWCHDFGMSKRFKVGVILGSFINSAFALMGILFQ